MSAKSNFPKSNVLDKSSQINSADEFMAAKAKRKADFLNQSKGIPSSQANKNAKLISNLKPSDAKILKFSE